MNFFSFRRHLTCASLSQYLIDRRHGKEIEKEDETKLMLDLVQEYSRFEDMDGEIQCEHEGSGSQRKPYDGQVVVSTNTEIHDLVDNMLSQRRSLLEQPELSAPISLTNFVREMMCQRSSAWSELKTAMLPKSVSVKVCCNERRTLLILRMARSFVTWLSWVIQG